MLRLAINNGQSTLAEQLILQRTVPLDINIQQGAVLRQLMTGREYRLLEVILRRPDLKLNLVHKGRTCLSMAVNIPNVAFVRLLTADARLNVMTILNRSTQETVLHRLLQQYKQNRFINDIFTLDSILELVLAHASVHDLDQRNTEGWSALGLCMSMLSPMGMLFPMDIRQSRSRPLLLQHVAQPLNLGARLLVTPRSLSQNTYYHRIALNGSVNEVKYMLAHGARPWLRNAYGQTAAEMACPPYWRLSFHALLHRAERQFEWGVFLMLVNNVEPWCGLTHELLHYIESYVFI
jgi:ankyrin repeat protein